MQRQKLGVHIFFLNLFMEKDILLAIVIGALNYLNLGLV